METTRSRAPQDLPQVPSVQLSPRDESPTPVGLSWTQESPRLDVVLASIELGTLSVSLSLAGAVAGLVEVEALVCCRSEAARPAARAAAV